MTDPLAIVTLCVTHKSRENGHISINLSIKFLTIHCLVAFMKY